MLSVSGLSVTFTMYDVGLHQKQLTVISDLSLSVDEGELVAVVGASGSGKSLLAHALLGLLPPNAHSTGTLAFRGESLTPERQNLLRGKALALIPQSVSSLDPLQPVGAQVRRAGRLSGLSEREAAQAQAAVFERYGLAPSAARLYPFQLSGGMARRVLVATAAIGRAALLIADEPTPGLHEAVVRETLTHLRQLANEGRGVILITHDLEAALTVADRVAVFYAGTTVEEARVEDFADGGAGLRHPYSRALWQALPQQQFEPLPGSQPLPDALPVGCLFAPRCPLATEDCQTERPTRRPLAGGWVRCIHAAPVSEAIA